jgi:hypothetical protein
LQQSNAAACSKGVCVAKHFNTINQYFDAEPYVSVQTLQLNSLLISALDESSNDISIASTSMHSVLVSLTGSDYHHVRIGDKFRAAPTRPGEVSLIPSGIGFRSAWRTKGDRLKTVTLEFGADLFRIFAPEIYSTKFSEGHLVPSNYLPRPERAGAGCSVTR